LNRFLTYVVLAISAIVLSGCKSSVPEFELVEIDPFIVIDFQFVNGEGEHVELNEQFTDLIGYRVDPLEFKYYLSNLTLSGDAISHKMADIELVNHQKNDPNAEGPQWGSSFKYQVPAGQYNQLSFGLGVPADLNESDPANFASEHPLSVYSNMYWAWATMYRFVVIEAKIDTNGGSDVNQALAFHTGLDDLYRPFVEVPVDLDLKSFEKDTLVIEVDWNTMFHYGESPIHLKLQSVTHTTDTQEEFDLAERFTDNMIHAFSARN